MKWYEQGKKKAVTFSYDDGTVQDVRLIELLDKYGLKSTFNLCSGWLPKHKDDDFIGKNRKVCRGDVKHIYAGHEVAAHTIDHLHLTECDDAEVIRQVENDRQILSDLAGYEVLGMAYPYCNHDDRIIELIKNNTGIKYSRAGSKKPPDFEMPSELFCVKATSSHLKFDMMMSLAEEFIELKADTPKVFYIYGHSYELDQAPDNWARAEEFFKLISNRDDIFYGTNKDVLL